MPLGTYDNETGLYLFDNYLFDGRWYEDSEGMLYIIPALDVVAENEGPDNEIMDAINARNRAGRELSDEDVLTLGLSEVPSPLKRWSPLDGYYHA